MKNTKTKFENIKGEFSDDYRDFTGKAADFFRRMIVFMDDDQRNFTENILKSGAMGLNQAKKLFDLIIKMPSDEGAKYINSNSGLCGFENEYGFCEFLNDSYLEMMNQYIVFFIKKKMIDIDLDLELSLEDVIDENNIIKRIEELPVSIWLALITKITSDEEKKKAFKFLLTYHYSKHGVTTKQLREKELEDYVDDMGKLYSYFHSEIKKYDVTEKPMLSPDKVKFNNDSLERLKKGMLESLEELIIKTGNTFKDSRDTRTLRSQLREIATLDKKIDNTDELLDIAKNGILSASDTKS